MVQPSSAEMAPCLIQAKDYGSGKGLGDHLDPACARLVLRGSTPHARKLAQDGSLAAFGSGPILYFRTVSSDKKGWSEYAITGNQTGLSEIRGMSLDPEHHEISVLDDSHPDQVLTFSYEPEGGNLVPRPMQDPKLEGVLDLAHDSAHDVIFAANPARASVLVLNRQANVDHPSAEARQAVKGEIKGPRTGLSQPRSVTYINETQELVVVDAKDNRILIFDGSATGDVAPKRVISGKLNELVAVGFNPQSNEIEVLGRDSDRRRALQKIKLQKSPQAERQRPTLDLHSG